MYLSGLALLKVRAAQRASRSLGVRVGVLEQLVRDILQYYAACAAPL